ncbi:MAG TPA: carbohydrate porin, partial [Pirellulales bacterium]|nr:carbohydrate porin [Pirellulales bacterium]
MPADRRLIRASPASVEYRLGTLNIKPQDQERRAMRTETIKHNIGVISALGAVAPLLAVLALPAAALAQSSPTPGPSGQPIAPSDIGASQIWAMYGQSTFTEQYHPAFRSDVQGANSLNPGSRGNETFDATLYAGVRPWAGGEIWINPEIDQGFGLSDTLGVAAFTSAEAYKVGAASPYAEIPRLFFRQTLDLGGGTEKIDPTLNVLGGTQTANRLVLWVGKFSVTDIFDTNAYANDGRNQFLNWALVNAGTFDYAANSWGYTYGAAAEWYQDWWTLRAGGFALSTVPNSPDLDTSGSEFQLVGEAEERHHLWGRDGKLKVTGFLSRGRMGDYNDATALAAQTGTPADIAAVRRYRSRSGISINLEQSITDQLGLFARAGTAQGGVESYEFSDIDKTFSVGLALQGKYWNRPDDTVGLAFVIDDISRAAKNYLNAGGLGILVGDGSLLDSGPESVAEAYYRYALTSFAQITADYQLVNNPGYDRLRGPVSV